MTMSPVCGPGTGPVRRVDAGPPGRQRHP